jgi:hypothetical protein
VTPLNDLGPSQYLGFSGGLYPRGRNSPPVAYEKTGVTLAARVQPVDGTGQPSLSGKIVVLSIGMSHASREFSQFIRLADADSDRNSYLLLIDGAREGAAATQIAIPFDNYWTHVDRQLESHTVSPAQVQVVWLKTALARDHRPFPENAFLLQRTLRSIVQILGSRFKNLKLVYVSSRTYGGYSETDLSPEPAAYESAFAGKWLIEDRINNAAHGALVPWVAWGPYLWADGLNPRSDGLIWQRSDFESDGVHISGEGALKVAMMLLHFFKSDPTSRPWFVSQAS